MKRRDAAETLVTSVAQDLFATEAAIDEAMMQIAALAMRLPTAGRAGGFAATCGQPVYDSIVEAMAGQARARSAMVDIHNHLAQLKDASPLRTVAIGGGTKPPLPENPPPVTGRLARLA